MKTPSRRARTAVDARASGPREDEHGFDVEQHEQQGEDVVADWLCDQPSPTGIDAALVVEVLLGLHPGRANEAAETEERRRAPIATAKKMTDREVVAEEL